MEQRRKLEELILYISKASENDPHFGRIKLNKLLYFIDFEAYRRFGRPVTEAQYLKRPFGPVPELMVQILDEMKSKEEIIERQVPCYGYTRVQPVAISSPNMTLFSKHEIELVEEIIAKYREHNGAALSELSHDRRWRIPSMDEKIPYGYVFIGTGDPPESVLRVLECA